MKGRTAVTITHRLSTIKNVDEIIVLGANGKGIVQRGKFNELKSQDGHFKKTLSGRFNWLIILKYRTFKLYFVKKLRLIKYIKNFFYFIKIF